MEVTAIRLRSQGDGLPRKGSGPLAVHLEFLSSDIPPVPRRIFCDDEMLAAFTRMLPSPVTVKSPEASTFPAAVTAILAWPPTAAKAAFRFQGLEV